MKLRDNYFLSIDGGERIGHMEELKRRIYWEYDFKNRGPKQMAKDVALRALFSDLQYTFLKILTKQEAEFLVLGGPAIVFYGYKTKFFQLDLLVRPSAANGEKIITSLKATGLVVEHILPEDFEGKSFFSFGQSPDWVGMFTRVDGFDFETAFNRRVLAKVDEAMLPSPELSDLIEFKRIHPNIGPRGILNQLDIEGLQEIKEKQGLL